MKYIKLLRPKHWVKNTFLFIPLFFAGELFNTAKLLELVIAFFSFSITASSIYILNDYQDIAADRLHPVKCKRPLASGEISKQAALVLFVACILVGYGLGWLVNGKFVFILSIYFVMNILYCLGLKHISILDIMILSTGFVLRAKCGGVAAQVPLSEWLVIMIFLLALFMAIAKRRDDILIKQDTGKDMRKAASGYNSDFLNVMLALVSAIIIVAYLTYTISPETQLRFKTYRLYYTTLFVIGGLLRYLQITYVENNTGSPTKILYKDRFIQLTIILWVLSFYVLIYLPTDKKIFE
ncbi:decaprenyl-phosphate phosphoribosyltransferase [Chitinophaga sp. 30R24]|uniref:decaprenyl-phosphate phosphoribosyltransferase n=1 Tax=Chitinophaga sp. 30R24 TaxID=3248838 RepID=UPI003B8F387B